jgi:antitoxin YefM
VAKTVPFSEARARLTDLVDEVEQRHEHFVITRNGRPAVVVMSTDEYEALQETLEILDDEATMEALRRSDEDVAAGRVFAWDEVKRELGLA